MTTLLAGGEQGLLALQEQPQGWEIWERTDQDWLYRRVWCLTNTPTGLLAGTDGGLWRSLDRGVSWSLLLPATFARWRRTRPIPAC